MNQTSKQLRELKHSFYKVTDIEGNEWTHKQVVDHIQSLLDSVREEYKGKIEGLKMFKHDPRELSQLELDYNAAVDEFNSKIDEVLKKLDK